jgi:hypothetical protein
MIACGIKGPPLPPIPGTPQDSDLQRPQSDISPYPQSSPSPSLRGTKNSKKDGNTKSGAAKGGERWE